jgi:hypothetical protein
MVTALKLANSDKIALTSIGGSGVQSSDTATIPFEPEKIGTSIYYAFDCESILAVNSSLAATPRLVVRAQSLDVSVSSMDAIVVDCEMSVSIFFSAPFAFRFWFLILLFFRFFMCSPDKEIFEIRRHRDSGTFKSQGVKL